MKKRPPVVDLPTSTCSSIIEKALSFKEMSLVESATDYALFDDEWEGDDWPPEEVEALMVQVEKVNKMFPKDLQAVIEWSLLNYRAGLSFVPCSVDKLRDKDADSLTSISEEIDLALYERGDIDRTFRKYQDKFDLSSQGDEVRETDNELVAKKEVVLAIYKLDWYRDRRQRLNAPRDWWWYLDELTPEELQAIQRRAELTPETLPIQSESTIESPVALREQGEQYGEDKEVI